MSDQGPGPDWWPSSDPAPPPPDQSPEGQSPIGTDAAAVDATRSEEPPEQAPAYQKPGWSTKKILLVVCLSFVAIMLVMIGGIVMLRVAGDSAAPSISADEGRDLVEYCMDQPLFDGDGSELPRLEGICAAKVDQLIARAEGKDNCSAGDLQEALRKSHRAVQETTYWLSGVGPKPANGGPVTSYLTCL